MRVHRSLIGVVMVVLTGALLWRVLREPSFVLSAPEHYITDVAVSEDFDTRVQKSLKATFLEGVRTLDWQRVARGLAGDFQGRFPRPEQGRVVEDDQLSIRQYESEGLTVVGREGLLELLRAHVDVWTSVERASWHSFEFLLDPSRERAFTKVHLELGGPGSGGQRSVLNATIAIQAVAAGSDEWKIQRLDLLEGMRVENPSPPFREITDQVGLHFNRSDVSRELRQRILDSRSSLIDAGLSVVDWNRDGFYDVLATESRGQNVLFLNDGKGGFVRGPLTLSDRQLIPSQFLFVDLDNDGVEELVTTQVVYRGDRAALAIHTREGGAWLEFKNVPGLEHSDAMSLAAGDINSDGLIDLFVANYETNQSRKPGRFNLVDADDGADNFLFVNHGGLRFTEESDIRGITGTRYTYVAQFFDLDGDGDLDLFEGNDYARNVVWDNQGDGTFRALPDHPLARDLGFSMGVTIGDWDNTGDWSVYISKMYSHAGNRIASLTKAMMSDEMHARVELLARGNQLFKMPRGTAQWEEQAGQFGVNDGGWAWGNVFFDLENDGDKEIFVANGNTSFHDPKAPDF